MNTQTPLVESAMAILGPEDSQDAAWASHTCERATSIRNMDLPTLREEDMVPASLRNKDTFPPRLLKKEDDDDGCLAALNDLALGSADPSIERPVDPGKSANQSSSVGPSSTSLGSPGSRASTNADPHAGSLPIKRKLRQRKPKAKSSQGPKQPPGQL